MNPLLLKELRKLIQDKKFHEARALSQKSLVEFNQSADLYFFLGVSEYQLGDIADAKESLKKALKIDPVHTDAAICLSILLNDLGNYDEAKKVFQSANASVSVFSKEQDSNINQKFALKHVELADLYFRYRRFDEALDEYSKAINLDPSLFEIRIRRARALAKKGYLSRAIDELNALKRERPHQAGPKIQMGLLHASQGNMLDAELEWEGVLAQDPKNDEARNYLRLLKEGRLPKD